jgi:hypothetical protein
MQKPEVKARRKAHEEKPEIKARNKTRDQNNKLKRQYDLDSGVLAVMVLAREGKCEITGKEADLVVDHVKGTKVVRGLLTPEANLAIGLFQHSINNCLNAADYLCAAEFDVFAGIKRKQLKQAA